MMRNFGSKGYIAGVVVLFAITLIMVIFIQQRERLYGKTATLADLPKEAIRITHRDEDMQSSDDETMVMQHYGAREAIEAGGPIYGTMGYRIVSVEYEVPANMLPEKAIGQIAKGYLLKLPEFRTMQYDHFHISYHPESTMVVAQSRHEPVYSIHFMLIPHEEELLFGLVCE